MGQDFVGFGAHGQELLALLVHGLLLLLLLFVLFRPRTCDETETFPSFQSSRCPQND